MRRMCRRLPRKRLTSRRLLHSGILLLPCICWIHIGRNLLASMVGLQRLALTDDLPQRKQGWKPAGRFEKAVHIVHTRFMQDQPTLGALGASRIELFKTFCLPTMVHQNTNDFLWVILIDPDLDHVLLDELKRLVKPYPHFFLIKLKAKEIYLNRLDLSLVISGDVNLLAQANRDLKTKVFMQTRLDADDGLANIWIEHTQASAVEALMSGDAITSDSWIIQCVMKTYEWHYVSYTNETSDLMGWVRMSVTPSSCVTPGLTLASAPGVYNWTQGKSPSYPHHTISLKRPKCENATKSGCYHVMKQIKEAAAIRARTPASSFMKGVGTVAKTSKTSVKTWNSLERLFAIKRQSLIQTRNYLIGNIQAIAKENLESQCTGMNSCKEFAKKRLEQLASGNNATVAP